MAIGFAGVVRSIKERFPEFRGVPVYVGSSVCLYYGPCFLSEPGRVMAEKMEDVLSLLADLAVNEASASALRRAFQPILSALASAPAGVHLPEDISWVEVDQTGLQSDQLEAIVSRIRTAGLEPTEKVVAEFMVLHEFGHWADWLQAEDKEAWNRETQASVLNLLLNDGDLAEGYRQLKHETRADEFALTYLERMYKPQRRSLLDAVLGLFDAFLGKGVK